MFRTLFLLLLSLPLCAVPIEKVEEVFSADYVLKGSSDDEDVMLCLHGFGMDETIACFVHDTKMAPYHLVGFNFPDWGDEIDITKPEQLCFGTIAELKPAILRLHSLVTNLHAERIHLYGFSAGGGAAVNLLSVLRCHRFQKELGLTADEMDAIYAAIERGTVVLDCPLKSIDEIADAREAESLYLQDESSSDIQYLKRCAAIYKANDLRPIDSLLKLSGSKLNVVLVLQQPDDIVSNRDDALFVKRLEAANCAGKTVIVYGPEGCHVPAMPSLVTAYTTYIL